MCNIPLNNKKSENLCHACCLGKSHRLHAPLTHTKYSRAFELIHTDLWRTSPTPSRGGYSYYVYFVDAHTRYTWIYMLKHKSDALNTFKLFQSYAITQFNSQIKDIQSDFRGEFRPFTRYLNELGILHKLTCPHTTYQNVIVERNHKQILEMRLALITHAYLQLDMWDHSFTPTMYLINRTSYINSTKLLFTILCLTQQETGVQESKSVWLFMLPSLEAIQST